MSKVHLCQLIKKRQAFISYCDRCYLSLHEADTGKEQLVLGEVSAFIQEGGQTEEIPRLILRKHSLFSGYEKWQVEREDTKEVYQ